MSGLHCMSASSEWQARFVVAGTRAPPKQKRTYSCKVRLSCVANPATLNETARQLDKNREQHSQEPWSYLW